MKETERGGGGPGAASVLRKRMIQVGCGANLNPEMTDVFSTVFY